MHNYIIYIFINLHFIWLNWFPVIWLCNHFVWVFVHLLINRSSPSTPGCCKDWGHLWGDLWPKGWRSTKDRCLIWSSTRQWEVCRIICFNVLCSLQCFNSFLSYTLRNVKLCSKNFEIRLISVLFGYLSLCSFLLFIEISGTCNCLSLSYVELCLCIALSCQPWFNYGQGFWDY